MRPHVLNLATAVTKPKTCDTSKRTLSVHPRVQLLRSRKIEDPDLAQKEILGQMEKSPLWSVDSEHIGLLPRIPLRLLQSIPMSMSDSDQEAHPSASYGLSMDGHFNYMDIRLFVCGQAEF